MTDEEIDEERRKTEAWGRELESRRPKHDSVIEAVRADLLQRSQFGLQKYGVSLDRADLKLRDWLQHAYEECLDQANYLKRAILTLEGKP